MIKNLTISFLALFFSCNISFSQQAIDSLNYMFQKEKWISALNKAKKENKHILLLLYIENWENDMKRIEMILKQDTVQSFFKNDSTFISIAYNTNYKGLWGKTLKYRYDVMLPTFIFLDKNGTMLSKISLVKTCSRAEDFNQVGEILIDEAQNSITKGLQTSVLIDKFNKQTINDAELKVLVKNTLPTFSYKEEYGDSYLKSLDSSAYLVKDNIPILCRVGVKDKKVYNFLVKNAGKVRKEYGDTFFVNSYFEMYLNKYGHIFMERTYKVFDLFNNKDTEGKQNVDKFEKFLGGQFAPHLKRMLDAANTDLKEHSKPIVAKINFMATEVHQNPVDSTFLYLDNYCNNSEELVFYANATFRKFLNTKKELYKEKAVQWIKKSIQLRPNVYNLYALHILTRNTDVEQKDLLEQIKEMAQKEKLETDFLKEGN